MLALTILDRREIRQTMLPVALCSSWTDYARNRKPCDRQSFLQPRASDINRRDRASTA